MPMTDPTLRPSSNKRDHSSRGDPLLANAETVFPGRLTCYVCPSPPWEGGAPGETSAQRESAEQAGLGRAGWEGSPQPGFPEFLGEVAPGATSPLGQAKATRGNNTGCL